MEADAAKPFQLLERSSHGRVEVFHVQLDHLVATTLPHSRSEDNEFTRCSGLYDLCLLTPRRVGLPFGRYPRLAFVWIITEAVRRQTPQTGDTRSGGNV